ncbi:MAG: thioredoxin-disulfide reductase [Chitinispirillales bacterium]|jgi:thioredoxin reductase (NADPH)|nr:thioredoxin-disulfide reductase [Chitinispirillales bacterium]
MIEKEVIVIGSGPAGYTASIYLARAMLEPLLFEGFSADGTPGGQLMKTSLVENFSGFSAIEGQTLMYEIRRQAINNGVKCVMVDVISLEKFENKFILTDSNEIQYSAKAVIVATGTKVRRLELKSEEEFWMKGISACAVCDGGLPIFRNKTIAVIGGGDSAAEEAIYLTKFAQEVYLIHRRDKLRASKIMQKHLIKNPKIKILYNKIPVEFYGGNLLEGMKIKDVYTDEISDLSVSGCFEAIGNIPNTKLLKNFLDLDENGYIITDKNNMSSVDGVFAAGDVMSPHYRQAIIAAGNGAKAALACEKRLLDKE